MVKEGVESGIQVVLVVLMDFLATKASYIESSSSAPVRQRAIRLPRFHRFYCSLLVSQLTTPTDAYDTYEYPS